MECIICNTETGRKPGPGSTNVTCSYECLRARRKQVGQRLAQEGKANPPKATAKSRAAASKRMTGAGCPKFNGYRSKTSSGYTLVRVPEGYQGHASARGYIREHRLVMEQHLGRLLTPKEVVHHKNGNKIDNSIENLELVGDHNEHIREHIREGMMHNRWPKCIYACGKQAKPTNGRRYHACAVCRRLNPLDARSQSWDDAPRKRH